MDVPVEEAVLERKPNRAVGLIVLGVIALVIAGAIAAYFFVPQVRTSIESAVAASKVPADLRSAVFVGLQGQKSVYYTPAWYGFTEDTMPLVDAPSRRSPDGSRKVNVEASAGGLQTNGFLGGGNIDPNMWSISLRSGEDKPQVLARGYGAAFLDDTHIVYFSQSGIVVRDLASNTSSFLFSYPTTTRLSQVQYSPNRSLVAWTDASNGAMVVASIGPDMYRPIHVFNNLVSPVLTDSSVYEIRQRPGGMELWRRSLDGSESASVLRLPEALNVILIQSSL